MRVSFTPEQVEKGVKTAIEFGAYPIAAVAPVLLPLLLASETGLAQQEEGWLIFRDKNITVLQSGSFQKKYG